MEEESIINLIFIVSLGMLSLVLILVIIMYFSREKIHKEKMKRQKLMVEHEKELLVHSFRAQEKERDRLSAELHDGIASKLNIIHIQIASIERNLPAEVLDKIDIVKTALQTCIEDTRRISHDLFPMVLENFGLVTALNQLKELNHLNGIKTYIETNIKERTLELEQAVHIYRIIQELTNNSLRHASCSEMHIALNKKSNGYLLIFSDNGIGNVSQLEQFKTDGGMGLKSIKSRLNVLNGKMNIENVNPGLRFTISF